MKTKIFNLNFLLAIFLISILGLVSCEDNYQERIVSHKPPVPTITIKATASNGGTIDPAGTTKLNVGGSKTFYFIPDKNYNIISIIMNGVKQPIADSLTVTADSELGDRDIKVEFLLDTNVAFISSGKWYLQDSKEQFFTRGDSTWYIITWDADWMYTGYQIFDLNGIETSYYPDGSVRPGKYTLKDGNLKFEGDVTNYKVITLNKDSLVLEYIIVGSETVRARNFYAHIPKKI